jgi:phosphoribosylformylglycinamidine synthase
VLGVIDELVRRPPGSGLRDGGHLLLLGGAGSTVLDGSRWAETAHGHRGGDLPALDVEAHVALCGVVRVLVEDGLVDGVHDVSDGGLGLALAEMAVRSGTGFVVDVDGGHAALFSEAPSRVVACVPRRHVAEVRRRTSAAGLASAPLGHAGGDRLVVGGLVDLALADAVATWTGALPAKLQLIDI